MHILFDQGTPVPLRDLLAAHNVETAYERGWSRLANGELLAAAEAAAFDVVVTTDQNLRDRQNLSRRRMAVVVLPTTSWPRIKQHAHNVVSTIESAKPGDYLELSW